MANALPRHRHRVHLHEGRHRSTTGAAIVARSYLWTEGNPAGAARRVVADLGAQLDRRFAVRVRAVGTTGSARRLVGAMTGRRRREERDHGARGGHHLPASRRAHHLGDRRAGLEDHLRGGRHRRGLRHEHAVRRRHGRVPVQPGSTGWAWRWRSSATSRSRRRSRRTSRRAAPCSPRATWSTRSRWATRARTSSRGCAARWRRTT